MGARKATKLYDPDLEWFIGCGGRLMGQRGTLASTINVLELGGHDAGFPDVDPYNEAQLGWGIRLFGDVERHRHLSRAWDLLITQTQGVLLALHSAPRAALRSDHGYGARDACPPHEHIEQGSTVEPGRGRLQPLRTGVEANLGRYSALAFWLAKSTKELAKACQDPSRKSSQATIRRALKRALREEGWAYQDWWRARQGRPRSNAARRSSRGGD